MLNDVKLNPAEIAVLSCDFSFIPFPLLNKHCLTRLMTSYTRFERSVRIKHYFKNEFNANIASQAEILINIFVKKQKSLDQGQGFVPPKA